MKDGQSASLSWNKAPIWGLRPDLYYFQTDAGLLMWGALSDERTCLSFTIAAGPRQRSHSRVRVPWDSPSYFTVSDARLPFSSPPTTSRATVEVFDPASTREWCNSHLKVKVMLRPKVSRPVCLRIKHPSVAYDQIFITVRRLRVCNSQMSVRVKVRVKLRLTVSQSVCLGVEPRLGLMTRY
jgi:hypothetical protein